MKKWIVSFVVIVLGLTSTGQFRVDAADTVASRVQAMLSTMTLEQKAGQMLQPDTRSITPAEVKSNFIGSILSGGGASPETGNSAQDWADRLNSYQQAAIQGYGIPLLYGVDAVHGHNNVKDATIFPHNIGLGQANDSDLMERIAKITAIEMRATGANWTFTPTLGLPKNERWGRTYECFGEDANLSANLGAAYIRGSQGNLQDGTAIATAKHFIGEGITANGINQGDVPLDYNSPEFQQILQDELLVPYRSAIHAGAKSVMVSYNSIDGVKCHGNKELITDLLKGELDFKGIVISDYNGVDQIEGGLSYQQQIEKAVNAGLDMIMVDGYDGSTPKWKIVRDCIVDGVKNGTILQSRVDDAVSRILTVKMEMGLIDNPNLAYADTSLLAKFGSTEHRQVAREAVRKSLTLLKNSSTKNGTSTLMNDIKDMNKIVVAGSSADDIGMQCGGWTMSWQGSKGNITSGTTIYSGFKEVANAGTIIDYNANGYFADDDYQAAIVVVGETPYAEYAGDRSANELKLSDSDIKTINRIKKDHPDLPIIAILTTGRPITIASQVDQFDAIIMAGFPGSEGAGIGDVLFGNYDFQGKLTMTWPWYAQDIPSKFTDSTKVLFENGRGLTKSQTDTIATTKPTDPNVVDLQDTNGVLEAEKFVSKHPEIRLENNGTTIGYFWEGYDLVYRIKVPAQGKYQVVVNAATEYDGINAAMDMYVDNKLFYQNSTPLPNTGGWSKFKDLVLSKELNLPAGEHELKVVSQSRDFNIDKFKFIKVSDDYEEPNIDPNVPNIGTGALIKEEAVSVTMSSSENSQDMSWYAGDQEIENRNSRKDSLDIRNIDTSEQTTIVVNDDKEYQSILGIGTSIEESTVNNMMKMSPETRKKFIKQLLDPVTGMGNTLLRITIGTSDFTGQEFYTYYDGSGQELSGKPDWNNTTGQGFSIQKDRDYGIIQVIKEIQDEAKKLGVDKQLKFFASSWTPPGWMKAKTTASDSYKNNDKLLKGGKLKDEHISNLAKYYVRFIEEYKKEGIPIYAMTLQNEPLLEIDYPSCYITGGQEAKLAKAIKEELAKSTILNTTEKDVKVWAFDHNFDGAESYVAELFASQDGRDNVDGIAFHPYGGVPATMGSLYEQYKSNYTMHLTERSVWGTNGANDIIDWFRNGSESYNGWVTMLDSKISPHHWVGTPDPTMFVQDANNREKYWCTPEVYIIGQFSKYIRPGYKRIESNNGTNATVTNVAFKDPKTGKIVLVVTNRSGQNQDFKVVMDGTQFNATLPAGNVATYSWDPIDSTSFKEVTDNLAITDATITGSGSIGDDGALGYIDHTTKVNYLVNVKAAGTYRVIMNVAPGGDWDKDLPIVLSQGGNEIGRVNPRRYVFWGEEWSNYSKYQTFVTFENSGLQSIELTFPQGGMNFKDISFIKQEAIQSIPGLLNTNNSYQTYGTVLEESDQPNLGYCDRDDYIDYKVNVQKAGNYVFNFEVATNTDDAGIWIDSITDSRAVTKVGDIDFANGGDLSNYQQYVSTLYLNQGEQTLRFKFKSNNINYRSTVIGQGISIVSEPLVEGALNGKTFTVTLHNATFNTMLSTDHWDIDLPKGVTYTLTRMDDHTVKVTLHNESSVDFDIDQVKYCIIKAEEFSGMAGTTIQDSITIKAVDDPEELQVPANVLFNQKELVVNLSGGTFSDDIVNKVSLTGTASKYVTIQSIDRISSTQIVLHLTWQAMYGDSKGTITVSSDGYDDGTLPVVVETNFKATNQLPTPIPIAGSSIELGEDKAYRNEGSLKTNPVKGNYADFFIRIPEAGQYRISYKVKTSEAVSNGLKISGGLGLATDNLASISFGKFWDNQLGYYNLLTLPKGDQTLRFEMNAGGFTLDQIKLENVASPTSILENTTTTVTVDDIVDGSKTKGWGIETKNGISSIGCNEAGSYQDYQVEVATSGIYDFSAICGGSSGNTPYIVLQDVDGSTVHELGRVEATKTGDWDSFVTSPTTEVRLAKGAHTLRIYDDVDGFNYRSFSLTFKEAIDLTKPMISGVNATVYKNNTLSLKDIIELHVDDDTDGDITNDTSKVTITSNYEASKVGVYTITVLAKDTAGNISEGNFTVSVVNPATITFNNSPIAIGSNFNPMEGIKVLDIDGKDITDKVKIISNTVDTKKAGTYQVIYQVVDKLGTDTQFIREVIVQKENNQVNPDISIDGKPSVDKIDMVNTNDASSDILPNLVMSMMVLTVLLFIRKRRNIIN